MLAGKEFETHLQEVVRLGLLWNYGGFYIDPTVRVTDALKFILKCSDLNYANAVVTKGVEAPEGSVLQASFFPRKHLPFIGELAQRFDSEYPTGGKTSHPMKFNFQETIWTTITDKLCNVCPLILDDVLLKQVPLLSEVHGSNHYGTLSYNSRHPRGNFNVGDEIQGFPGLQFLPYMDTFIERDNLIASRSNKKITAFFNAFWAATGASWPPPNNMDPILLSLHINRHAQIQWARHGIKYLKQRGPIGARDFATLKYLRQNGVEAFFSACLTLLLKNPNTDWQQTEEIYMTDVGKDFIKLLPKEIQDKAIKVMHEFKINDNLARFTEGCNRLRKYICISKVGDHATHSLCFTVCSIGDTCDLHQLSWPAWRISS